MAAVSYVMICGLLCLLVQGKNCPTDCHCSEDVVNCSQNQLMEIPSDIPNSARTLNMNFNRVTILDLRIIFPLKALRTLELKSNLLHEIKPGTFLGMNNLERLDISDNRLTKLNQKTFFTMNSLKDLIIRKNLLKDIEGAISHLFALELLDLSQNRLTTLNDRTFTNLPKLKNLKLSHNDITHVAMDTFTSLTSMMMLDVSNNPIRRWDGILSKLPKLSMVNMKNCLLEHFPTNLSESVQFIDVSANNLTRIFKTDIHPQAVILNLNDNTIAEIEEGAFLQAPRLSKLELQNNYLTKFPKIPSQVHHLNIQNNVISSMDAGSFPEHSQLGELFLQKNMISNISSSTFRNVPLLKKLSIGDNPIQNFSSNLFYNVSKLIYLNVDKMHIKEISGDVFNNLESLLTLSMSGVKFSENSIKGNFLRPLSSLNIFDLSYSPSLAKYLLQSSGMLRSLQYISQLNLMANNITTLPNRIMGSVPHIETLNILDNTFHCDQRLVWLSQWIKLSHEQFARPDEIVCYTPLELFNRSINKLQNSDFIPATTPSPDKGVLNRTEPLIPTQKPLGPGSISVEQTGSEATTNTQFIALTVSVSVFIVLIAIAFVIFHVCRQSRGLVYNRSTIINHPTPVNFFISNEENAPIPPTPPKLTREDRCSVTSQTSRDITSEEQGVKVYTWSG